MPTPTSNTAVIGGGLGGLAAACTLAARGHHVSLFDKNPWLGGKAAQLDQDGYRFDMAPTILTLPSVLKRIFAEAGKDIADYLDLVPLDPQWRCFYTDGSTLDLESDVQKMAAKLDAFASAKPGEGNRYKDFIAHSKHLDKISEDYFFWRSVGSVKDTLDLKTSLKLSTLSDLRALRMGRSVAGTIRGYAKDHRVAQLLDHFTQYVGSSPDASPAVLCGIAHMQVNEGIWYPMGGTRAVPLALEKLARELGVEFHTGTPVAKILTDTSGAVSGLETARGETYRFDSIVSNSDAVRTFDELVGSPSARRRFNGKKYTAACSGVVLYLGLKNRYDHLLHHNFVFSENPEEEFRCIYQDGQPAPDPTAYVCAPAATEPGVAPPGGEALYVLVHTPYLRHYHDWNRMFPAYRQTILDKLKSTAGLEDIESNITYESALTPQDIHDRYHVLNGAIYGLASHGKWFGAFKPANRSPHVPGLYLGGGSAHPGPGMPMVLMSGWIAADSLHADSQKDSQPTAA